MEIKADKFFSSLIVVVLFACLVPQLPHGGYDSKNDVPLRPSSVVSFTGFSSVSNVERSFSLFESIESSFGVLQSTDTRTPSLYPLTFDESPPLVSLSFNESKHVWVWSPSFLLSNSFSYYEEGTLYLRLFAASPSYLELAVFHSPKKICHCGGDSGCTKTIVELEGGVKNVEERNVELSVGRIEDPVFVSVCLSNRVGIGESPPCRLGLSAFFPL